MKRTTYREPIQRCQAITQDKKRCIRDAVAMHNGKGYCSRHHGMALVKKVNDQPIRKEKPWAQIKS
jgi:hypothetical protein